MENEVMTNNVQETNAMPETTVDINDVSAATNNDGVDEANVISIDLLCGSGISIDIDSMDWGDLYNKIPEMDTNVTTLKSMIFDVTHMGYSTPDEIGARDKASESIFNSAMDFLKSMGIPESIDYNLRSDTTMYEKALLSCMDAILIMEAVINEARVQALMNVDTSSMLDQIIANMPDITIDDSNIDDIMKAADTVTVESPLPVMENNTNKEE